MILSFFIVYNKRIYLHCCVHWAPTTVMPSQVVQAANCKKRWYSLTKWQISRHRLPPILKSLRATRWKPSLWSKSSQQPTLVPKVSLGGKEKQQWHHVLRTTDVWTCRRPPVQVLCNRWFALSLPHKSKRPTWHLTQWSKLLCHWMHLNANATWRSQWSWLPQ